MAFHEVNSYLVQDRPLPTLSIDISKNQRSGSDAFDVKCNVVPDSNIFSIFHQDHDVDEPPPYEGSSLAQSSSSIGSCKIVILDDNVYDSGSVALSKQTVMRKEASAAIRKKLNIEASAQHGFGFFTFAYWCSDELSTTVSHPADQPLSWQFASREFNLIWTQDQQRNTRILFRPPGKDKDSGISQRLIKDIISHRALLVHPMTLAVLAHSSATDSTRSLFNEETGEFSRLVREIADIRLGRRVRPAQQMITTTTTLGDKISGLKLNFAELVASGESILAQCDEDNASANAEEAHEWHQAVKYVKRHAKILVDRCNKDHRVAEACHQSLVLQIQALLL